jgi:predicted O-methyltransferase YrrM
MSHSGRQVPRDVGRDVWKRSDEYHRTFLHKKDEILEAVLKKNSDEGLPEISVSPSQGKFLQLLARSVSARYILEVGTLGGLELVLFHLRFMLN